MFFLFNLTPLEILGKGKKVYIFSSKGSISEELKTGGDGYFDLREINEIWGKDLHHRVDEK